MNSTNTQYFFPKEIAANTTIHIVDEKHQHLCNSTKETLYALGEGMSAEVLKNHELLQHDKLCKHCYGIFTKAHDSNTLASLRSRFTAYCEANFTPLNLEYTLEKVIPATVDPDNYNAYENKCIESLSKSCIYLLSKKEYLALEPFIHEHKMNFSQYYDGSLSKKQKTPLMLFKQIGSLENSVVYYNIAFKDSGSFVSSDDKLEKYLLQDFSAFKALKKKHLREHLQIIREDFKALGYSEQKIAQNEKELFDAMEKEVADHEKQVQMLLKDIHSDEKQCEILYTSFIKENPYLEISSRYEDNRRKSEHISIKHINIVIYEASELERNNNKRARFFKEGTRVCQNIWYINRGSENEEQ